LGPAETEIFLQKGLDKKSTGRPICPSGKSLDWSGEAVMRSGRFPTLHPGGEFVIAASGTRPLAHTPSVTPEGGAIHCVIAPYGLPA
jgi:hypothetical protein